MNHSVNNSCNNAKFTELVNLTDTAFFKPLASNDLDSCDYAKGLNV